VLSLLIVIVEALVNIGTISNENVKKHHHPCTVCNVTSLLLKLNFFLSDCDCDTYPCIHLLGLLCFPCFPSVPYFNFFEVDFNYEKATFTVAFLFFTEFVQK